MSVESCFQKCSKRLTETRDEDNPLYAGRRPPGPVRGEYRPRAQLPPVIPILDMEAMRRGRERGMRAARERAMAREREKEFREARERAMEEQQEQEAREEQAKHAE